MKTKVYVSRYYDVDGNVTTVQVRKPVPCSYEDDILMSIDPTATYVGGPNGIQTIDKFPNEEIVQLLLGFYGYDFEVMTDAQVRARFR